MDRKIILAGLTGAVMAVAGTSFAAVEGENTSNTYKGDFKKELSEEMREALENNDYDSFVEALPEDRNISEERFEEKVEFFQARESGDEERLEELRAERKAEREEHKEDVKTAIETGDYTEFVELLGDRGENITEDHFDTIVELHEARENGDTGRVMELREELKEGGVKLPGKHHGGGHKGGPQK